MNQRSLNAFFSDHETCESNTKVASVVISDLLLQAAPEIKLTRVVKSNADFDCGVLHLTDCQLATLLEESTSHSFRALLVTTEAGIPLHRTHRVLEEPTRIVLAVRRMKAFADPAAWKAFLSATESDCIAIAENRFSELSEVAKPMLGFFIEQSVEQEILLALKILCSAYLEVNERKSSGDTLWNEKAAQSKRADWWRKVFNKVMFTTDEWGVVSWKKLVMKNETRAKAVQLVMERISQEAIRQDSGAFGGVEKLIELISKGDSDISERVVKDANSGLNTILR